MSGDIFARIRAASAEVTRRARSVRIDAARLEGLAAALAREPEAAASLDPARHQRGDAASTLAYVVTLDAINFGSGYFPFLAKRPGLSGYFTVAGCLGEAFDAEGAWSAARLRALDAAECARIFAQDPAVPEAAELMGLFAQALIDLGRFLEERYEGSFEGPLRAAGGSAARLVEILDAMPSYRDVAVYDSLRVPFYKRAQLTAADLASAFEGKGLGCFHDLDRLTLFADNLVPHVLRREGVLVYVPELARRIDAGEILSWGSPEEVEIRAGAVHAVEGLVDGMRAAGSATTARELDAVLWNRGQRPEYKAHPRHRTRTTFY